MALRLLFTGDLSFTGTYRDRVLRGEEIFDEALLHRFREADHAVVNFEGPATTAPNVFRADVEVVSPPGSAEYALARGLDVFNLANNHVFDAGLSGYRDTVAAIGAAGGLSFGAGEVLSEAARPLFLEGDGVRAALVGVCHREGMIAGRNAPGVFCDDLLPAIRDAIEQARERADWVILNHHGGEEYTSVPMPRRRRLLHGFLDLGADLVVAHHPHVLQGHERRNGKPVVYSLGNFVFDLPLHRRIARTDVGGVLELELTKTSLEFRLVPVFLDRDGGRVRDATDSHGDLPARLSDFRDYRRAWRADAYRTIFRSKLSPEATEATGPAPARRFPLVKGARAAYALMKGRNSRPVFLGALAHLALDRPWRRK